MTNEVVNGPELRFPEFSEEWKESKLGDIADITMGQSPKSTNYTSNNKDMVLVQGNADMKNGQIHPRVYTKEITKLAEIDNILLSVRAPVGELALAQIRACIGRGVCAIKANKFIYYYLELFKVKNKWKLLSQGSTFESISGNEIKNIKFHVPMSISEQQKINKFFSKLDRQIELEEQKLKKLEEQKKGYMQQIFSQELRFKDKNGNDYPEYEEKNLKELIDVRDGTHESPKPSKEGYLLVTSKNLKNSKLDLSESYFISKEDYESINQRSKVEIGDILFGMIGTIGNPILLEECGFAIKNVALLKTSNLLEKYYILNFLKSSNIAKQFYRMNAGGTQKFIALSTIRELKIDMPSSEEAIKIGNFFNKIDSLTESQSSKIKLLKEQKKGFLQKMFV